MVHRISPLARVAAAVAVLGALGPGAAAQSIPGRVVLAGWHEHVADARVQLLGPDLSAVAGTVTDADGRFLFPTVNAGQYYLQATFDGISSALAGPIHVPNDDLGDGVLLELPSELYDEARACLLETPTVPLSNADSAAAAILTTGVLAGVAYDEVTTTPLPGARVTIRWGDAADADTRLETRTNAAGHFVFCRVPARVPLTVRLDVLGRVNAQHAGVRVQPGALARMDLSALLTATSRLRVLESTVAEANPDSLATVQGQLLDAVTEGPVAEASIVLEGVDGEVVTNQDGQFRITGVTAGEHAFRVSRLGYDWRSEAIDVEAGATVVVELRAAPSAIGLEAVVVRVTTPEMRMAKAASQAPRILAGTQLSDAEQRASTLEDVIRWFPSLQIRHGQFETDLGVERGTCIESSRALMRYAIPERKTPLPWCEMIAIVIDGAPTFRATEMVAALRLRNVESIEFLPPTGALRYGERAALNGALVIWTRGRGPHQDPGRWIHGH